MKLFNFFALFCTVSLINGFSFAHALQKSHMSSTMKASKTPKSSRLQDLPIALASTSIPAISLIASASPVQLIAKVLGYIMGVGSMTVYTPILINLFKEKSSKGLSVQTWIFNVIGISLAASYPFQKGFPISSYIEMLILSSQSLLILGVVCFFNENLKEFLLGLIPLSAFLGTITLYKFPDKTLQSLQILSALICNYANVPQIYLSFKEKRARWSRTTALMSVVGNLIRVFTTIKLTKDPFFLFGFLLGAITNGILFIQTFIYSRD